ncbi:MAG: hypothetical protein ACJ766_12745 [Thermoleophilaceae bacterium]
MLALLAALGAVAPAASAQPTVTPARPFSPDSFWNAPLGSGAPIDPDSPGLVADLVDQVRRYGPWINTYQYSSPVYRVPAGQPRVKVILDTRYAPLQEGFASVPLPANAQPARGNDRHLVVWQPSTDSMWEFFKLQHLADGWHARWGGRMTGVSRNPGYFPAPTGATATGLPLLGGLITLDEMKQGHIDHALDICLVRTRQSFWSWPAQRTDGWIASAAAIPEGTRFRLDPALDLSRLRLPRVTRMIAEAAQRYGIVVRDKGGAVSFYAEDPVPTGSNPYGGPGGYFQGRYPSQLLQSFPWDRLQVLKLDLHHG